MDEINSCFHSCRRSIAIVASYFPHVAFFACFLHLFICHHRSCRLLLVCTSMRLEWNVDKMDDA
jgi:hypothetical protein